MKFQKVKFLLWILMTGESFITKWHLHCFEEWVRFGLQK